MNVPRELVGIASPPPTIFDPPLRTEGLVETISGDDLRLHEEGGQDKCHDSLAERIPHEIVLQIISHLSPKDLLLASMVNHSWKAICTSSAIWLPRLAPTFAEVLTIWESFPLWARLTSCFPAPPLHLAVMALHGFNFLRNPWFLEARNGLRGDATDELTELGDRNPWSALDDGEHSHATWKRAGWIPNRAGADGFRWECPPQGVSPHNQLAAKIGPPASLSYPPGAAPTRRPADPKGLKETAGGLAHWVKEAMLRGLEAAVASAVLSMSSDDHVSAASDAMAEAAQVLGVSGCIATSSEWTELIQVVDFAEELMRRGLSRPQAEQMLDSGASLGFSLMVAGHSECEGQFAVGLMLDEGTGDALQASQQFVMSASRCHTYSGRLQTGEEAAGQWQRYAQVIHKCPVGFRRAIIVLRGKDRGQRAGFYGVKFASAELRFVAPAEEEDFGATLSEELWSGRKLNDWR